MKATIVPNVIGSFDTITKGLLKDLEELEVGGRVETIQMTALLRKARIVKTSKGVDNNENADVTEKGKPYERN